MTPGAALAVHLAEHVMQQDVCGPRRIGARVVADDAVEAVHGLDRVALEPVVEVVAGRHGEQRQQLAPRAHVEPPQTAADARRAHQLRQRRAPAAFKRVRRRGQHQVAQHVRDGVQALAVLGQACRIVRREARHLRLRATGAGEQIAAVRGWQEVGAAPLDDAQAVAGKIKVADDLRVQQRDRIGGDRVAKPGVELLGDRGAADHCAPLEHGDLEPRRRQVRGAHQPVVSATDDQCIAAPVAALRAVTHGSTRAPEPAAGRFAESGRACAARNCAGTPPLRSRVPRCSCSRPCPPVPARSAPCPRD